MCPGGWESRSRGNLPSSRQVSHPPALPVYGTGTQQPGHMGIGPHLGLLRIQGPEPATGLHRPDVVDEAKDEFCWVEQEEQHEQRQPEQRLSRREWRGP